MLKHSRLAAIIAAHEVASGATIDYGAALALLPDSGATLDDVILDVDAIADDIDDVDALYDFDGKPVTAFGRLIAEIESGYRSIALCAARGYDDIADLYMAECGAARDSALGAWLAIMGDYYLND